MNSYLRNAAALSVLAILTGCFGGPEQRPQAVIRDFTQAPVLKNPLLGDVKLISFLDPVRDHLADLPHSMLVVEVPVGGRMAARRLKLSETVVVFSGFGRLTVDRQIILLKHGKAVFIPANAVQHTENTGTEPLIYLSVIAPSYRDDLAEFVPKIPGK
ncbi:MAG: cupin domain-containing protein [Victivallaceae bacterium]|nr:cupin domain-containing protein [Victivallaceae bacterium]